MFQSDHSPGLPAGSLLLAELGIDPAAVREAIEDERAMRCPERPAVYPARSFARLVPEPAAGVPQTRRKLVAVEHADQLLVRVKALVGHRAPLAVLPLDHVGDYGVGMKLGIEVARGVVAEGGGDDLLVAHPRHPAGIGSLPRTRSGVLHPGLGGVFLDPGQRRRHGAVVRLDDALVAAHQRGDGD